MENRLENIDVISCPSCGQKNENRARFCTHCGNQLPRRRKVWTKKRYIFLGGIGLILVGAIGYLLTGGIESKLVGRVNGEEITRKEFLKKVEQDKRFYEYRYGQNLFQGDAGKENLNHLKGADAKVTNFACHIQVNIIENGKVVVSFTYNQGEVQEI